LATALRASRSARGSVELFGLDDLEGKTGLIRQHLDRASGDTGP
jgi:hypothetical protein